MPKKALKGQSLREDLIRRLIDSRKELEEPWGFLGSPESYISSLDQLSDEQITDLHSLNFGFTDISDMDYLVIRADILIERSFMSLAAVIANNPIPSGMSAGAVRNFVSLMVPPASPFLLAARALSSARNIIAHQMHANYSGEISKIYSALNIEERESISSFKAAVILIICDIANTRDEWRKHKSR